MAYRMGTGGAVGKAVADYTGKAVVELHCHPDPVVPGTYAFRATVGRDRTTLDFCTMGVLLQKITPDDISECSFSEWPPASR